MGFLADWWARLSGSPSRPAAYRPPAEARFTEIGTNYPGAGTASATTWSAPNPYAGFDPTAPRSTDPDPKPSGPPAWGTPPGTAAASSASTSTTSSTHASKPKPSPTPKPSPSPSPSNPYRAGTGTPATMPSGRRRRVLTGTSFGVIAGVVIVGVVMLVGFVVASVDGSSGGGSGPPGGYAPELESAWIVASDDVTGDYGSFEPADGSVPGTILETASGWAAMIDPSTVDAHLVSLDPDTGTIQWSTPVPEARCTTLSADEIICLTRESGSMFQLVTIAADTGELVGDAAPTDLTHVPAFLVPMGSDGLVTLSLNAQLTGLDLQGTTLWTEPIDLGDYEPEWLEVDVAQLESSVVLYLGWAIGTIQATAAGVATHQCDSVAVVAEAWMCRGDDEAIGWGPDGTELWRGDWRDYYLIDQYQHIAPVMLVDNWDGTVSSVDPLTGDKGPAFAVGDERASLNFLGDPEHPFVFTDDSVNLLDADLTTVLWSTPIRDEYLNIAGGGVAGNILAIDAQHSYGFDLATGEMLWERAFIPRDALVVGDAFVNLYYHELIRYALP